MQNEPATALDTWLRGGLTQEYGRADDAIPDELLQLLPQDDEGGAQPI